MRRKYSGSVRDLLILTLFSNLFHTEFGFRISAGTPTIQTGMFRGLPQSLQENGGIIP
jgi:hypothetical protein